MSDEMYETGLQIRRDVLGAENVDALLARAAEDGFSADFQHILTEYCWGTNWSRTALSRRDRSLLNLTLLGALGRNVEFKRHVQGAIRNGVTKEEISDTLIHLAIYAGVPAGVEGFRLAAEALTEMEKEADA